MNQREEKALKVIVIGGGAAGFFAAINLALRRKKAEVILLEKTNKLLSKVKISGGGRCNVTHRCFENTELVKNYPRGNKELLQVFSQFSVEHTIEWFKQQGVNLKTEEDGRMFPVSNDSQTIVDCFLRLAERLNITIKLQQTVVSIHKNGSSYLVKTNQQVFEADRIICALGGHPKAEAYQLLKGLGHNIVEPIPSLFTLNLPKEPIKNELQGLSVKQAEIKITGSKLKYHGPVLITHWGLSGPAVLKLSAFAAKEFFNTAYRANIRVNWVHPLTRQEVADALKRLQEEKRKALPYSNSPFHLPKRLWEFLCTRSGIDNARPWAEIGSKQVGQLTELLFDGQFAMEGKTTFKEEFVTCGGLDLKEINFKTMQSKRMEGLFFCGEVLNIDGITGGFNFQSAWSTAWVCANSV